MCPFMWDLPVGGLLAAERTAAMAGSSGRQDLRPGERLARVWHICADMPFLARPGTTTPQQNKQGDESTSQAEYAGSIPVIGSTCWTGSQQLATPPLRRRNLWIVLLASHEIRRAPVRFGLLAGAVGLLIFLVFFQQTLLSSLLNSFTGALQNQSGAVLVYTAEAIHILRWGGRDLNPRSTDYANCCSYKGAPSRGDDVAP